MEVKAHPVSWFAVRSSVSVGQNRTSCGFPGPPRPTPFGVRSIQGPTPVHARALQFGPDPRRVVDSAAFQFGSPLPCRVVDSAGTHFGQQNGRLTC